MKEIDVTKKVMRNVAEYERTGISRWVAYFIGSVSLGILGCIVGLIYIVKDLLDKHAFDLFELFSQDPEIIADFWKEVLTTFWGEIPQTILLIVLILTICLISILLFTRSKRMKIKKKLQQLEKYS